MPYTAKANRFFRARAHGFVPDDPKLRKLSPDKAAELAVEGVKRAPARKVGELLARLK